VRIASTSVLEFLLVHVESNPTNRIAFCLSHSLESPHLGLQMIDESFNSINAVVEVLLLNLDSVPIDGRLPSKQL